MTRDLLNFNTEMLCCVSWSRGAGQEPVPVRVGVCSVSGQPKLPQLWVRADRAKHNLLCCQVRHLACWHWLPVCSCIVLAQRGVLRERTFINYLKYLLYWKEPEYAKFLKYVADTWLYHHGNTHRQCAQYRASFEHIIFAVLKIITIKL